MFETFVLSLSQLCGGVGKLKGLGAFQLYFTELPPFSFSLGTVTAGEE